MSEEYRKHNLSFIRKSGLNTIENLWVVEIIMIDPAAGLDDAWRGFKQAVTDWVLETDTGRKAWEDSCEDFNIGDFFVYYTPSIMQFLWRHGIHSISIVYQLAEGEEVPFDKVLVDRSRLEPETDDGGAAGE